MSIIVNVINQKMYVSSHVDELVAGSQNFVKFKFNLDEEWENLVAFAQFQQNGIAYNQYLDDKNTVYLPSEICAGFCTLMLYGSYDKAIGTTNCLTLKIGKNMLIEDAESTEISESLYTQLVTQVQNTQVRLDNLIASEGISSDTEIIDARVDFQGTTWGTIGNAIRGATQVANRATYIIGINADGTVNRTMPAIQDAYLAGKSVVLFDGGYVAALEGIAKVDAEKTGAENFIYTFRCHDENGVQRVYEVYYKDSNSVFRQYDTKIRAVWRVGVELKDGVYQANRTVTEMSTAYQDGKNLVCWLGGRELYLIGTDKDGNGLNRFHFSGGSADGSLVQRVTVYAANGSADNMAQASVYSDLPCVDLSGYAMLGKVGIIGDSLSLGVEDNSASESIQNTDHSWGAYLSRTAGNPCAFFGFSGATSSTWIMDKLDEALKEENRCDAYIVGLGFNDCRGEVGKPNVFCGYMSHISDSDTFTDVNHDATPYGSYYYNIGKILRKLHTFNPDAPIFVLTNPEATSYQESAADYNQALVNICAAEYGTKYNAHLIDLKKIYGPIFENLEAVRGDNNHFDRQTYAYMGQIIGTAITRDIRKNPGAYPQLKGYLPDETGEESDECIFYVNMIPISDSEATSDKTFEEIVEAHNVGKNVKCKIDTYVLPLCFITNVQVIFGGATSNLTTFVTQYSNNTVEYSVAELALKDEVPTKEAFDSLANKVDNLPSGGESGGGNVSYYETSFVLGEGIDTVSITLPAEAKKFYMWKLDYRTPNTGVTDRRTVYIFVGGGHYNMGATDNYGCVSLTGIKHVSDGCRVNHMTRSDGHLEHCVAGFLNGNGAVQVQDGRNDIILQAQGNIVFPAGTEVWFWGVYHK